MRSRSTRYVFQLGPSKRNEGKKLFELPFRMDQKTGSPSALTRRARLCQYVGRLAIHTVVARAFCGIELSRVTATRTRAAAANPSR